MWVKWVVECLFFLGFFSLPPVSAGWGPPCCQATSEPGDKGWLFDDTLDVGSCMCR